AADIDSIDIVDAGPVVCLGLHLNLPPAPEQVDIVDVEAAERGLQHLKEVAERHTENLRLVAIDVEVDRWVGGGIRAEHARELRIGIGRYHEPLQGLRQRLWIPTADVLEYIGKAAASAEPQYRRRCQGNNRSPLDLSELLAQAR